MAAAEDQAAEDQADMADRDEPHSLSFDQFYQKYKERITAYIFQLTGDYQRSLDVMQESFTRYFSSYRDRKKSRALLYTIARNTVFDSARKNKKLTVADDIEQVSHQTPEKQLIEKQKSERITRAFRQLNLQDQELLFMVSSQNRTYRQIGTHLNLSEGNVKVKVHRARVRLMDLLKKEEE